MIKEVFTPYITKNGKRIYHPTGGVYHFFVEVSSTEKDKINLDQSKKTV